MKMSDFIKKKRIEKDLSHVDLANRVGINHHWLRDIEADEDEINWLNIDQFGRLCNALEVRPNELFESVVSDVKDLSLGDLISRRRNELGWSIETLARRIEYDPVVIQAMEVSEGLDEVCIDALKKLAAELNLPLTIVLKKL